MTFIERHLPKTINDLVFREPYVAKTIGQYATGERTKHLLLYGPAGSGKSEAARILVDTLAPGTAGTYANEHINPKNFKGKDFGQILNSWSAQANFGGASRGFVVIDEVDWFAEKMMHELRGFMDDHKSGTIICTTNHLNKLDDPLKNRFKKLHVEWPTVENWLPRAKAIMAIEGYDLTDHETLLLLKGFHGSGRDLIEWLEDYVLTLNSSEPNVAAPAPAHSKLTLTSPIFSGVSSNLPPTLTILSGKSAAN